jgi:2,4-dienoyl-CoA reductase-like NADH-dependent reductase (Old Yellow Enzyme family)
MRYVRGQPRSYSIEQEKHMVDMFTPGKLGNLELDNRLMRSAVWEAMADENGFVTDSLVDCSRALAEGGVGLIILGYSHIQPNGRQQPGQTALFCDEHVAGMRRVTDAVHEAGGKVSTQIVHVGPQTNPDMIGGETPVAPSEVDHRIFGMPRALTTEEVWKLVEDFGHAARRSVEAGFDAIQIHGAHGYLVSQFISPLWNQRTDEFGGSLEGRMRFAVEVYESVRRNAGDIPVFIKLNVDDFVEGSTTPDDSLPLASKLDELGIDGIEVSAGGALSGGKGPARTKIREPQDEAYLMDLARLVRREVECTVIGMGGFRSPEVINETLASGDVDFISMARPLIREPGLINRWRSGQTARSLCESCNGCYKTLQYGKGIQCLVEYKAKERARAC